MGMVLPKSPKPKILEQDIRGAKYFKLLGSLLNELHEVGTERDKAGHRQLYFDHYGGLLLLYFFTPILTSLRGIQQASELKKVQRLVGCKRASLGSLSEASSVFEAGVLQGVIQELAGAIKPLESRQEWQALAGVTAVDGSLLPALPKMAWALWLDEHHRAAKMHIAFEVLPGIPVKVSLPEGNGSERDQLRGMLEAGRLYVLDRGYAEYVLFQDIINAQSSLIGRLRDNAVWTLIEQRELSNEDKAAGIQRDLVVQLGGPQSGKALQQPLRVIEVLTERRDAQGQPETLLLATDRLDLEAHLVALGYRYRWSVELFFRWFKCILGCRYLLSTTQNGVAIQVYLAIIASLLISLWTERKPTKRTFEMLCFYFSGMADEDEVLAHIKKIKKQNE
jgi:Transposase DDE domain